MGTPESPNAGNTFEPPALYASLAEKAALEQRNGLLQFDNIMDLIREWQRELRLTPDVVRDLHATAILDLYPCGGEYRSGPIEIKGSSHRPPSHDQLPELVEAMCRYANGSADQSPVHTAAYLMWRVNWIHPFNGGNGRTSRAVSYLALSVRFGVKLPGRLAIPDQIVTDRKPYFEALEAADAAWQAGRLDVVRMEALLDTLILNQLRSV